ncbi:hypothetical protein ACJMK2_002872, partial [Sinanodonta woodiana]
NEGSKVHWQKKLAKMKRGEHEDIQEKVKKDTSGEGHANIRENYEDDYIREAIAKDGDAKRSNK